uniref:Uncharacterized protein n=1 Tax=Parascaris equorum TaxID=6256 RepID=A0A914RF38_PAREQ
MLEACARSCLELRDRLKMVVEAQAKERQLTKKFDEIAVFDQADRHQSPEAAFSASSLPYPIRTHFTHCVLSDHSNMLALVFMSLHQPDTRETCFNPEIAEPTELAWCSVGGGCSHYRRPLCRSGNPEELARIAWKDGVKAIESLDEGEPAPEGVVFSLQDAYNIFSKVCIFRLLSL